MDNELEQFRQEVERLREGLVRFCQLLTSSAVQCGLLRAADPVAEAL